MESQPKYFAIFLLILGQNGFVRGLGQCGNFLTLFPQQTFDLLGNAECAGLSTVGGMAYCNFMCGNELPNHNPNIKCFPENNRTVTSPTVFMFTCSCDKCVDNEPKPAAIGYGNIGVPGKCDDDKKCNQICREKYGQSGGKKCYIYPILSTAFTDNVLKDCVGSCVCCPGKEKKGEKIVVEETETIVEEEEEEKIETSEKKEVISRRDS